MLGPVAVPAHRLHETSRTIVLILDHPALEAGVEVKTGWDQDRGHRKEHVPPAQTAARSKFPFVFHPALSLNLGSATRNPQFHRHFSRGAPPPRRRNLAHPAG